MIDPRTAPSPELFFQTLTAYQRTEALKAALVLDVFTGIAGGMATAGALAERSQTSARGMRILCDYLTTVGFLTKAGDQYALTPDSATFLDRRSPAYLGGTLEFVLSREFTEAFRDVAAAVRRGGTVMAEGGTVAPEHPIWVAFARAMMPITRMTAQAMASLVEMDATRAVRVLDVAAGHGLFGITLAERHPNVEVVALDWPSVLEVARENARAAGVSGRYGTIEGNAFEVDWGHGYDLVLLTNFLHHFDQAGCERLLRKARAALADGGRAVTLEFVPNEDRVSPPETAGFALVMLCTTPSGDAYTFAEYDRMFHGAGFARNEIHPLPPTRQQVIVSFA
ncbi:MAG: methyltransferase [Candidatus Rokuibacteriota bacterium]